MGKSKNDYNVKKIFENFKTETIYESAVPYGSGHINDTFLIRTKNPRSHDYILQHINHDVFKNVPELVNNIRRVTQHLKKKLQTDPNSCPEREALTLVPARNGEYFFRDQTGLYWRCYIFIDNTNSYNIVKDVKQAREGGRAFGKFLSMLADLAEPPLYETIPDFHNIRMRLDRFEKAVSEDSTGRVREVEKEISYVRKRRKEMPRILKLAQEGKIPLRVTHNDTKFNNVLLTKEDKGLCVVDLDTVMPGYIHYDFGDSIRTATNTASEDEKDLKKIRMDLSLFKGFTEGFLSETKDALNQTEIDSLAFSAKLMTYMVGVRFLTDYLDGDKYFKTDFADHNLQRCRAQFALCSDMEAKMEQMEKIIKDLT